MLVEQTIDWLINLRMFIYQLIWYRTFLQTSEIWTQTIGYDNILPLIISKDFVADTEHLLVPSESTYLLSRAVNERPNLIALSNYFGISADFRDSKPLWIPPQELSKPPMEMSHHVIEYNVDISWTDSKETRHVIDAIWPWRLIQPDTHSELFGGFELVPVSQARKSHI